MNGDQRKHLGVLERRQAHLKELARLGAIPGQSYNRAERAALAWAVQIIRAAEHMGALVELEAEPVPRPQPGVDVPPAREEP
jgi:hypothetical protein